MTNNERLAARNARLEQTLAQVQEQARVFVMGGRRAASVDSRSSTVGCVFEEQIVGRILYRVWPLGCFGPVA